MAFGEVRVEGLAALLRAFGEIDKELAQDLAMELEEAVDPIRKQAEQDIVSAPPKGLRNMPRTPFYSKMRIAANRKEGSVYIVPKWRSSKAGKSFSRPKLADAMQPRMQKTVEDHVDEIEKGVERFLDKLADDFNRGRYG